MIEDFIDCRNYSVSRSLVDDAAVKSFFTRKNIALVKSAVVRRAVMAVRPELVACEHMLRDVKKNLYLQFILVHVSILFFSMRSFGPN